MSEPVLLADWFGRGFATVVGAGASALVTIFATRRKTEASLLDKVNDRIDAQMDRLDAEIINLRKTVKDERMECDRQLHALRVEIAQLLGRPPPIPAYTSSDIEAGQKTVRAAVARHKRKTP